MGLGESRKEVEGERSRRREKRRKGGKFRKRGGLGLFARHAVPLGRGRLREGIDFDWSVLCMACMGTSQCEPDDFPHRCATGTVRDLRVPCGQGKGSHRSPPVTIRLAPCSAYLVSTGNEHDGNVRSCGQDWSTINAQARQTVW